MAIRDSRSIQRRRRRLAKLIVQWVENKPELEKYVGKSLGQIAQEEGKHPSRRDARSVARRPT